jgi:plasmid stabilization system protein ParE
MSLDVSFAKGAEEEFLDAISYYKSISNELGRRFKNEVETTIKQLRESPDAYPLLYGPVRKTSLQKFPYKILYEFDDSALTILAVAHHRRRPFYWTYRLN